mmetsp:Transcript_93109/g.299686  ORF Transcript_93109/g.299686 Transcript_93109/m.299686 type:complete len:670 (+) Transcript_93109:76-2085(+)
MASGDSSAGVTVGFSKTARRTFHDVPYLLAVSGDSEGLCIEVEHAEEGQKWRSRFPARFIEEITQRTGNAKKFDIFVRMLLSALAQESDAVYLDVLTARDLEMLRRHANPQGPPTTSTSGQSDKRYLILTYRAEFDKVHYPLPLPLEERSEVDTLRAQLARARAELSEARATLGTSPSVASHGKPPLAGALGGGFGPDERLVAVQRHNSELADALRVAQREVEASRADAAVAAAAGAPPQRPSRVPASGAANDADMHRFRDKIRSLQADLKAMSDQVREKETRHKKELDQATRELKSERQKVQRLEQQAEKLQQQAHRLEEEHRNSGPGRPGSRAPSADRARSRSASADRSRPPSRPTSGARQPPARPASQEGRSRQPSRASSVASSRERTPSPSNFLHGSGGGAGGGRRPSSGRPASSERPRSGERPKALQRSSSPGMLPEATLRNLSPYKQPPGKLEPLRRAPSPGQQRGQRGPSRGRTPSPSSGLTGTLPSLVGATGERRAPASLRERSGSAHLGGGMAPAPGTGGAGPRAGRPPSASSSRGGGYVGSSAAGGASASASSGGGGGYAGAGYGGPGIRSSASRGSFDPPPPVEPHRPGSYFGLASDLGLAPGTGVGGGSGGGGVSAGALGGAAGAAGAGRDAGDACDIDARLQALQSFLKQTRNISS